MTDPLSSDPQAIDAADQPASDQPAPDQPVSDQPVSDQPATDQPVAARATALGRVCIFTGSTPGQDPSLVEAAESVGRGLAAAGIGVVYGGGGSGLMGAAASGALGAGGEVIGVIPDFMVQREWGRSDLSELHVVESMHERKALMAELSDAFLVLPGGIGTLEEFFEVWTWRQIGLHAKPVALLDLGGFWQPLVAALDGLVEAGFVSPESLADIVVAPDLPSALAGLAARPTTIRESRPRT